MRGAVSSWLPVKPVAYATATAVAALVALPLVSLLRLAAIGDAEIWPHLAAYVLPAATIDTVLLLAGST